ncbi:hypothetical protein [Amedibacillus dolichus]|nr:hypothetical protein [Amedibacillus dolichus]
MHLNKIYLKSVFMLVIIILTMLSHVLNIGFIGEFIYVWAVFYLVIIGVKRNRLNKIHIKILFLLILILMIGIIGNLLAIYKPPFKGIVMDIVNFTKLPICFISFSLFWDNTSFIVKEDTMHMITLFAKIFTAIAFLSLILNFILPIGMGDDIRYGIESFKFIYDSAAWLNQYWIFIVIVLFASISLNRKNSTFLFLALIVWSFTLRSRAIALVFITVLIYLIITKKQYVDDFKKRFLKKRYIISITILMGILGLSSIKKYFLGIKVTARQLLLENGITIMKDYFPFGSGLATYGTEAAKKFYSPLYHEYNLSSFWALKENGTELTDTFWPAVGAQIGFFGLLLYICLIVTIFKYCIYNTRKSPFFFGSVIIYGIYLFVSSTATGIFFSDLTAIFITVICLFISLEKGRNFNK